MPTWRYKGLDAQGATVEGRLSAADEVDALRQLEGQSIAPFDLAEAGAGERRYARRRARAQDRFRFIRQLSVLLRAGASLLDAFETVAEEEPCRELAEQAAAVRRELRSGAKLSQAVRSHMPALPEYAPRLIELGETTGQLPRALADIADQMDSDLRAAAEVRNALAYPAFLAVAGVAAILFIFLFVVPRFANLIGDDRSSLPGFSRWVIETGVFLRANLWESAIVAGLAVGGVALMLRRGPVRRAISNALFAAPVIGDFLRASETARWARITGTALNGGAGLLDALTLAEAGVRSSKRRQGLVEARRAIRSGEAIDSALKTHVDFDATTINLVRTGRASAKLDEMLLFIAEIFETEARDRAKRLTAIAEPLAVLFIASVVGMIVVALVLAMTSLYDVAL